jgi:hypothetical protein
MIQLIKYTIDVDLSMDSAEDKPCVFCYPEDWLA